MAQFNVSEEVVNINNPVEVGTIVEVCPLRRGIQTYIVRFKDTNERMMEADLKIISNISDPFELLKKNIFGNYLDFFTINTSFKIRNTSNNTISTLKASKTIFKAYQYKPLLKFLNSPNKRILIADEVGLGKTIEAGHILSELLARKKMKSALIVCPSSLQEKWKMELKNRFNLNFKIYQNSKDFIGDIEQYHGRVRAIVNYEKLRDEKSIIKYLDKKGISFDVIICDEAHKLRNSNLTSKGVDKLLQPANSVVFLTATPIMTSRENLFNLLRLLDRSRYRDMSIFANQDNINKPIIRALSQLNNNFPLNQIKLELESAEIIQNNYSNLNISNLTEIYENSKGFTGTLAEESYFQERITIQQIFGKDRLYNKVIEGLSSDDDSPAKRMMIQYNLSSLNTLNTILSRTRKKEVSTDGSNAIRTPHLYTVDLSKEEQEEYDSFLENYESESVCENITLGIIQKKRQVSSSLYATLNSKEDLNNGLDYYESCYDSKFEILNKIATEVVKNNKRKLIVFSFFTNTLLYLKIRFRKAGFNSVALYGEIKSRNEVISQFKNDPSIDILLSSEVGSEGLDLQFCDALVNYDLPWNPMVVEQRIGRIDRIGQKSPIINLYSIVVRDSIEEDIYRRLLQRINIFSESIGDLECILSDDEEINPMRNLDKILYSKKMSREQKQQKLDEIAKAIENERLILDDVCNGLDNAMTNDVYFENEIKRIQKNYKYVAEYELKNYIDALIYYKLNTCNLLPAEDNVFIFKIPMNASKILINFILEYGPALDDNENIMQTNAFINKIRNVNEIYITFNQETAYENENIHFINSYHPLTLSILEFFDKREHKSKTFQFSLSSTYGFEKGVYVLAVYSLVITRNYFKEKRNKELLIPVSFNLKTGEIVDDLDFSDKLLGFAQQFACINTESVNLDYDLIEDLKVLIPSRMSELEKEMREDQQMRFDSEISYQKRQETIFYDNKINRLENQINQMEFQERFAETQEEKKKFSILNIWRKELLNLKEERFERLQQFDKYFITSKSTLLSVNYINII